MFLGEVHAVTHRSALSLIRSLRVRDDLQVLRWQEGGIRLAKRRGNTASTLLFVGQPKEVLDARVQAVYHAPQSMPRLSQQLVPWRDPESVTLTGILGHCAPMQKGHQPRGDWRKLVQRQQRGAVRENFTQL